MPIGVGAAMLGSAAIGAAGSLFSGKQSADFAEESYKQRYQWQVKDLKKAGLNPMLAVSQGAPNVPQPNFPNMGEAAVKAGAVGVNAMLAKSQIENVKADTDLKGSATALNIASARESAIRSGISEEQLPFAAGTARESYYKLAGERAKVANEAEKISEDIKITEENYRHLKELQPLLEEYQRLQNAVIRADLPEKEANAAFWDALPEAAWVKKLREVLPKIGPIGRRFRR